MTSTSTMVIATALAILLSVAMAQEHPLNDDERECFTRASRLKFLTDTEDNAIRIGSYIGISRCMNRELAKLVAVFTAPASATPSARVSPIEATPAPMPMTMVNDDDDILQGAVSCYRRVEIINVLFYCSCQVEPQTCKADE